MNSLRSIDSPYFREDADSHRRPTKQLCQLIVSICRMVDPESPNVEAFPPLESVTPDTVERELRRDLASGDLPLEATGFDDEAELVGTYRELAADLDELAPLIRELHASDGIFDTPELAEMEQLYDGDEPLNQRGRELTSAYERVIDVPEAWIESLDTDDTIPALLAGVVRVVYVRDW